MTESAVDPQRQNLMLLRPFIGVAHVHRARTGGGACVGRDEPAPEAVSAHRLCDAASRLDPVDSLRRARFRLSPPRDLGCARLSRAAA